MKQVRIILKSIVKSKYIYLIVFLIGITVFSYPLISSYINLQNQTKVLSNYEEEMEKLKTTEVLKKKEEAEKYNAYIKGLEGSAADEMTDEERALSEVEYMEALNIGEVMGYVEIPEFDIKLPIYHGTGEEILQRGIGHMERTSLPVGGEGTHCVLAGHRGLPSARMFRDLDKLEKGDIFLINTLDEMLAYEVDQIRVVEPTDASSLMIEEGKDLVTLLTCDPYMINSHRLLVRGHRTEYTQEAVNESVKNRISFFEKYIEYFIIVLVFAVVFAIVWMIRRNIKIKAKIEEMKRVKIYEWEEK